MDKLLIDHLPIIAAIENCSCLSWDYIESEKVEPWYTMYLEEIADLNTPTAIEMIYALNDSEYTLSRIAELLNVRQWKFREKCNANNFTPSELSIIEKLYNELNKE